MLPIFKALCGYKTPATGFYFFITEGKHRDQTVSWEAFSSPTTDDDQP
jgi:hypothetical protein